MWDEDVRLAAEKSLLDHADALESRRLTWVPETPCVGTEACVGYRVAARGAGEPLVEVHTSLALDALNQEAIEQGARIFTRWNDEICKSTEEAVDFLRHAAKRVWA